jgi:hypothetical protein
MEHSVVQLLDLPDEMLIIILKKLSNLAVLYSLVGVNSRLDRLACSNAYTRFIRLVTIASTRHMLPSPDPILDRFCLHILPRIHHNVEWLTVEPSSIERILLAGDYPKLRGITLVEINQGDALRLFTGNNSDSVLYFRRRREERRRVY